MLQENLGTVHCNKVQDLQQLLAASQLAVDSVRTEAGALRDRVAGLQQEAAHRGSSASAASAAALQAQQVSTFGPLGGAAGVGPRSLRTIPREWHSFVWDT